jgi:hypothetical protein
MFELIQMTATYSNAVLLVVLTNVTDVAKKLDLPIIRPIQPAYVQHFVCDERKDSIGGWVTLTNGYQFWFEHGFVNSIESPECYFHLQDPQEIPRFYGTVRMTESEAVQMARQTIRKVGYNPLWLETEKPKVERAKTAPRDEPKAIPRYRVTWEKTSLDGRKTVADVEINADAKRPEMYWLVGREFERPQPNIPQPPVIPQPVPSAPVGGGTTMAPVPENLRVAATNEFCAKVNNMARQLGLPIKLPIVPSDIKEGNFGFREDDFRCTAVLNNGYRFSYGHGLVTSFYSPNSDTREGADSRTIDGKVGYTKQQVLDFATKQIRKLGYSDQATLLDQPSFVGGGPDERHPGYTRFRIWWQRPGTRSIQDDPDAQFTEAEVNGMTLQLESLWLRSTNLYQSSAIKP